MDFVSSIKKNSECCKCKKKIVIHSDFYIEVEESGGGPYIKTYCSDCGGLGYE